MNWGKDNFTCREEAKLGSSVIPAHVRDLVKLVLWVRSRVWQRDCKRGIQRIAGEVMLRGGPVERQAEPVRLLLSRKFNPIQVEGLIISGDGGQSVASIKKKGKST